MKCTLFAALLMLSVVSVTLADSVQTDQLLVTISDYTWYDHVGIFPNRGCNNTGPDCPHVLFNASFMVDGATGLVAPESMSFSASGALDVSGWSYRQLDVYGTIEWFDPRGYPGNILTGVYEYNAFHPGSYNLFKPGTYHPNIYVCASTWPLCGGVGDSGVITVTAVHTQMPVPEANSALLLVIALVVLFAWAHGAKGQKHT